MTRHYLSSAAAAALTPTLLLLLLVLLHVQQSDGFSTSRTTTATGRTSHRARCVRPLNSEVQTSNFVDAPSDDEKKFKLTGALDDEDGFVYVRESELKEHKPLGCSVEESLADEPDGAKYVFVAEVTRGGNADNAGIKVGDVIVQLSGTFDEVVDVAGLGIDKIRSLVSGRSDENPLIIRVARGSDVKERHELALVELCIIGDDATTADCITSIYAAEEDVFQAADDDVAECNEDDGTECMLDSMWSDWSDDGVTKEEEAVTEVPVEKKKVAQPWASRSSGSGTYVRNPKTGKMENIDEV